MPAGKVLETARHRAALEREFAQTRIDGRSGGGDQANIARRRAAIPGHTNADGDRSSVGKTRLAKAKRGGRGRELQRSPVLEEQSGVDAAEASSLVVACSRVVLPESVKTFCVVVESAERAGGRALLAGHVVAADRDVMEYRGMLCRQRIECEVGLALGPVFLVDEGHNAGHGGGRGGRAADTHYPYVPLCRDAIVGKGANGIEAVVRTGGGEQRDIGKVTCAVGGHATACLPGWLGIAARARGERAVGGIDARSTTAGSTAAGNDGGAVRAKDSLSRKVQAKGVVPRLLGNRQEERVGWQPRWRQVPEARKLSVLCSSRAVKGAVEEVGPPDRNVPRSGGETVHGKPLLRDLWDVEVVAAR